MVGAPCIVYLKTDNDFMMYFFFQVLFYKKCHFVLRWQPTIIVCPVFLSFQFENVSDVGLIA